APVSTCERSCTSGEVLLTFRSWNALRMPVPLPTSAANASPMRVSELDLFGSPLISLSSPSARPRSLSEDHIAVWSANDSPQVLKPTSVGSTFGISACWIAWPDSCATMSYELAVSNILTCVSPGSRYGTTPKNSCREDGL